MSVSTKWRGPEFMRDLREGVKRGLNAITFQFQTDIRTQLTRHASNKGSGGKSSPPGNPPGLDTGSLMRSWTTQKAIDDGRINDPQAPTVTVGSRLKYAGIHEFGGTIRAKGRALAIPIHRDAKRRSPRSFPNLVMIKRKGKAPLLVIPGKKRFRIMYVLKKSVTIPPRPYIRPALDVTRAKANSIMGQQIAPFVNRYR